MSLTGSTFDPFGSNSTIGRGSDVDDLFSTNKPAPKVQPQAIQLSPEFKMQLLGRIQEERLARGGYLPNLNADKEAKLEAAIASGDAVVAKINQNVSVILKKSDDIEASDSFFYRTNAGFAGTQYFGPFDT
jgi:hypothetical protein